MKRFSIWLVPLCLGLWLWACTDEPSASPPRLRSAVMPLPVDGGLLYLGEGAGQNQATIVRVLGDDVRVSSHALPEGDATSMVRPGPHDGQVVVLTTGRRAEKVGNNVREAVNAHVTVLDASGERARYELTGQYSQLALSDDGRFAIAFAPLPGVTLADLSCIVDLEAQPEAAALPELALEGVPLWFAFSPAAEGGRRLAVAAVRGGIRVIDLQDPSAPPLSMFLSLSGSGQDITPGKVIFRGDQIFIQSSNSSDVAVARLYDDPNSERGFRIAPSSLATEGPVVDMAATDADPPQLLTVGAGRARIVDPVTGIGVSTSIPLVSPRVALFEGKAPLDQVKRTRAVLYAQGATDLVFLDLGEEGPWLNANVERVAVDPPGSEFMLLSDRNVMVLVYEGGFSIVDLEARTVSPVMAQQYFTALSLEEGADGSARLWLTDDTERVALVDVARRRPAELLLNANVRWVVPLAGPAEGRIALVHPSDTGHFTLVDADMPDRASALEVVGFAWAQLFN